MSSAVAFCLVGANDGVEDAERPGGGDMGEGVTVLDLFSGLGGWSAAFRDRGHDVTTLDLDPRFHADHVRDLMTVSDLAELGGPFDVVLASPPCECFSVASIGRHWTGGHRGYVAKSAAARAALKLTAQTFALVMRSGPNGIYVVENPRGLMRKIAPDYMGSPVTTWMCQWGVSRAKPTDLWTNIVGEWPTCANGRKDHDAQSRYYKRRKALGQTGGTQGMRDAATRALIPYRLSLAVCLACERDGTLPSMEEVERIEAELRKSA